MPTKSWEVMINTLKQVLYTYMSCVAVGATGKFSSTPSHSA